MPLGAEQPDNIARAVDWGYVLTVSVHRLDTLAQDLETAINRILHEPNFTASAARVSYTMRAHRSSPVEKAAGKSAYFASAICHAEHSWHAAWTSKSGIFACSRYALLTIWSMHVQHTA